MLHREERYRPRAVHVLHAAALVVIAASLLVSGCGKKEPEAREIVRPVKMMIIGAGAADGQREYPGQVRAAQEIQLSFEVPGRLVELNALEGQQVAGGTLIAVLDPRDYEASRDRDLARRNEARADYQRNRTLYERDAISLRDLEVVRRQFEVAEANLRKSEKAVNDTRLVAPYDGKIAGRLVENHENVTAKQSIIVFHDNSSLEIRASFPESDFLRIRDIGTVHEMTEKLSPRVEISAAAGHSIDAWFKEQRSTADPVTRTYEVTLGFEAPTGLSITSGMTARVVIDMQGAPGGVLVPVTAVVSDGAGGSRVWVYDETASVVHPREVVVGILTSDQIEVLSGLEDGDTIAVLGANNLTEDMKVRPLGN